MNLDFRRIIRLRVEKWKKSICNTRVLRIMSMCSNRLVAVSALGKYCIDGIQNDRFGNDEACDRWHCGGDDLFENVFLDGLYVSSISPRVQS